MHDTCSLLASKISPLTVQSSQECSKPHLLIGILLWIWQCFLRQKTRPHMIGPKCPWINVVLCLVLVGPSLFTPFIESQTVFAAPAHQLQSHLADAPNSTIFSKIFNIIKAIGLIINSVFSKDTLGWMTCLLTAGLVQCPNAVNTSWGFECDASVVNQIANAPIKNNAASATPVQANNNQNAESPTPIPVQVGGNESAYQQGLTGPGTKTDWLSGDVNNLGADPTTTENSYPSGHLVYTYAKDTTERTGVTKILPLTLGMGFFLIGPLFLIIGYQFLIASWNLSSPSMMANAIEGLGRVVLAALAIGLSYQVCQMLISLTNTANYAMVLLHQEMPYSALQMKINTIQGQTPQTVVFDIPNDTPQSFRGLVMPMSLWGCVLDDFLGIIATRVVNALSSMIPIIGGVLGMAGKVTEIIHLLQDLSEFALFLLSITLWAQIVIRLILINYYIILSPIAFACWGLPGPMGSQVLRMWFKGMLQLLFVQTLQLFILTTLPSVMPDFGSMTFPLQNNSHFAILQTLIVQLPVLITTMAAVRAPKILMGVTAIQTVAEAGSMAAKVVGGVAATLYGMVSH